MKAIVLHSEIPEGAGADEQDVLVQTGAVVSAITGLGHTAAPLPFPLDLSGAVRRLRDASPDFVFNLVETVAGSGRLIHLAPSLLDHLDIPYTGNRTEAIFLTSGKLAAKAMLQNAGIPTPPWFSPESRGAAGTFIVKSVWEHASIGLDDGSIVTVADGESLLAEMERRRKKLGGECFAESYIAGREFNISLIGEAASPRVLPPAEIRFDGFSAGRPKFVGYRAKWEPDSPDYRNTPRTFDFGNEDRGLLQRMSDIAVRCWKLFKLRGYARVDFRVDGEGSPWVLEINANPCLSPDAGFAAAAERGGISYAGLIEAILRAANIGAPGKHPFPENPNRADLMKKSDHAPGELRFREEAEPEDPETVRGIIASSGFFSPFEIEVGVELVKERLLRGPESGYEFVFALRSGEMVGYACCGRIPCTRESFDLYWIAVDREVRGKGLGRRILAEAEERIRRMGGSRIYVETSSRDQYAPTRRFYEANGYAKEAVIADFYAPSDHKVIYLKALAPQTSD
jgi:D-alanine-D-alanine ligase